MGIQNQNGALYWATGIDNSGMRKDAEEGKGIVRDMSKDIEKTASGTSEAIDKIGKAAIESAKAQIESTKATIKKLEDMMPGLKDRLSKSAPGNSKEQAMMNYDEANRSLRNQKQILAGLEQQVDSVASSHVRLRTQIMNVKDELSQMEMAGKRGTVEYDVLQKKLGELNDQFKDTAAQATILANDQRGFQAVTQGVSGMAGAMSAATGVAALFGAENENLAKVQMRLQAVMAITIGLQQVAEMLNKDSYFSVVLLSKAKLMLATTELKLAAATGVSTAAARAFLISTGAIAIVGLVALAATIIKVSDAHKEQTNSAAEAAKKEQEILSQIAGGMATEKAKIDGLVTAIHSENVSRGNKLKMIKQLKDMIPGYTAELSKEGTVIRENKKAIDDYMVSLEKSLKLKAAEKELEAIYTKMYSLQKTELESKGELEGNNQFTKGIAKQGDITQQDQVIESTKKTFGSVVAPAAISELQKEADKIKQYISKTGLVSDVVLGTDEDSTKKIKEAYDATKDLQALLLDINQKTSSLLLDQQADSLQKRLAAIDLEKEAELQKIREKQVAIIEEYNKTNKGSLSTKPEDLSASLNKIDPALSSSLQTATAGVISAYGAKAKEETNKWNEELLDIAREFADKRVQIAYEYNEKIKQLEALGQKEAAEAAKQERDKAVSDETASLIEQTELYKMLSDEKLQISKETTEALLDDLRQRLADEWAAGKLSVDQMNKFMDQINEAQEKVSSKKIENNPFAMLGSAIRGQKKAKTDYNAALSDPSKSATEFTKLESAANAATNATAQAAAASLAGVQDILQSVVGGLNQLGVLNDQQQKDAENVIGMVGGAANLAMGIATGNPMAIIQGSIDLLVNGYELFDMRTKNANKEIANQEKAIERLKDSYEDLERAVDKSFSVSKAKLINQEIANLEAQTRAISRQISAERSKKKPDAEVIKEYEASIKENRNAVDELKDSWIEALAGTDVMSAIDSFAQAYADAWTTTEGAAKKSTEVVKGLIKNAIIGYMKDQLQPQVTGIMTAIANAMAGDGRVDAAEQSAIDALTSALDAKAAEYESALSPYLDKSKSGVTGELKAEMTEGTGSQLVGLWNMTAMDIRWIREWIAAQSGLGGASADSSKNINKILDEISAIKTNTGRTADNTEGLVDSINKLRTELEAIKNNTRSKGSRL